MGDSEAMGTDSKSNLSDNDTSLTAFDDLEPISQVDEFAFEPPAVAPQPVKPAAGTSADADADVVPGTGPHATPSAGKGDDPGVDSVADGDQTVVRSEVGSNSAGMPADKVRHDSARRSSANVAFANDGAATGEGGLTSGETPRGKALAEAEDDGDGFLADDCTEVVPAAAVLRAGGGAAAPQTGTLRAAGQSPQLVAQTAQGLYDGAPLDSDVTPPFGTSRPEADPEATALDTGLEGGLGEPADADDFMDADGLSTAVGDDVALGKAEALWVDDDEHPGLDDRSDEDDGERTQLFFAKTALPVTGAASSPVKPAAEATGGVRTEPMDLLADDLATENVSEEEVRAWSEEAAVQAEREADDSAEEGAASEVNDSAEEGAEREIDDCADEETPNAVFEPVAADEIATAESSFDGQDRVTSGGSSAPEHEAETRVAKGPEPADSTRAAEVAAHEDETRVAKGPEPADGTRAAEVAAHEDETRVAEAAVLAVDDGTGAGALTGAQGETRVAEVSPLAGESPTGEAETRVGPGQANQEPHGAIAEEPRGGNAGNIGGQSSPNRTDDEGLEENGGAAEVAVAAPAGALAAEPVEAPVTVAQATARWASLVPEPPPASPQPQPQQARGVEPSSGAGKIQHTTAQGADAQEGADVTPLPSPLSSEPRGGGAQVALRALPGYRSRLYPPLSASPQGEIHEDWEDAGPTPVGSFSAPTDSDAAVSPPMRVPEGTYSETTVPAWNRRQTRVTQQQAAKGAFSSAGMSPRAMGSEYRGGLPSQPPRIEGGASMALRSEWPAAKTHERAPGHAVHDDAVAHAALLSDEDLESEVSADIALVGAQAGLAHSALPGRALLPDISSADPEESEFSEVTEVWGGELSGARAKRTRSATPTDRVSSASTSLVPPRPRARAQEDTLFVQRQQRLTPAVQWAGIGLLAVLVAGGLWALFAEKDAPSVAKLTTVPADARVWVDGTRLSASRSPYRLVLEPGRAHEVRISRQGYQDQLLPLSLQSGTRLELPPITLNKVVVPTGVAVDSEPNGARVWIDGQDSGATTPARLAGLGEGMHTVRLARPGYQAYEVQAFIAEGRVLELPAVVLQPEKAAGADGTPVAEAQPRRAAAAQPRRGSTAASTTAPMSAAAEHKRATATAGGPGVSDSPQAAEEGGLLRLNARPWAQVTIDGKSRGNTPLIDEPLAAGLHTVELANPEMDLRKRLRIRVLPGKVTKRVVDLLE